jgi:hypothetical protein
MFLLVTGASGAGKHRDVVRTALEQVCVRRARAARPAGNMAHAPRRPATAPGASRGPGQRRFVALIVEPIAPNLAALRRVSSNAERA